MLFPRGLLEGVDFIFFISAILVLSLEGTDAFQLKNEWTFESLSVDKTRFEHLDWTLILRDKSFFNPQYKRKCKSQAHLTSEDFHLRSQTRTVISMFSSVHGQQE